MPHYKCGACQTRLRIARPRSASLVLFCPQCRSALDHVADLAELIGLPLALVTDPSCPGDDFDSFDEPASVAMAIPQPPPTP